MWVGLCLLNLWELVLGWYVMCGVFIDEVCCIGVEVGFGVLCVFVFGVVVVVFVVVFFVVCKWYW